MRDIGILIWVALLIVGVVGSMTSRIRSLRQIQAQRAPQRMQASQPTPAPQRTQPFSAQVVQAPATPARPVPVRTMPAKRPAPPPRSVGSDTVQAVRPGASTAAKRLFGDRRDLVRAVIAAEVLGKPRAFGDE
ncbi:MAG: hypothetical protein WBE77_04865 [Candidatus Cybelea sp.]